jgi:ribulose-5-phosphate 4-epimerase/fuculose-1-phosphate aldolase
MRRLSEISDPWFEETVEALQTLARELLSIRGAGNGHLSILIPQEASQAAGFNFAVGEGVKLGFDQLPRLAEFRKDHIFHYRAEGVDSQFLDRAGLRVLAGRSVLCSTASSHIDDLVADPDRNLCVVTLGPEAHNFKIEYGNQENGKVPTTGIMSHLLAHATADPEKASVVVHTHAQNLVSLARHPAARTEQSLNQLLQAQTPALSLQDRGVIEEKIQTVALLPFLVPDARCSVEATANALRRHQVVLWKYHGLLVACPTMALCMRAIRLLDVCAGAAFANLLSGGVLENPTEDEIEQIVETYRQSFDSPDELLGRIKASLKCTGNGQGHKEVPQFPHDAGHGHAGKEETIVLPGMMIRTEIRTFAPEPYKALQPIPVTIEPSSDGTSYIAGFYDANIYAQGDNEQKAFSNLRSLLLDLFDSLTSEPPDNLGPELRRQLAVLQQFMAPQTPSALQ